MKANTYALFVRSLGELVAGWNAKCLMHCN